MFKNTTHKYGIASCLAPEHPNKHPIKFLFDFRKPPSFVLQPAAFTQNKTKTTYEPKTPDNYSNKCRQQGVVQN